MRNIMLRNLIPEDVSIIERINKELGLFNLPDTSNPLTIIKKTIVEDGKIKGAILANITCDLTLVIDPFLERVTRAKILKDIFEQLYPELISKGFEDCQVFCLTPELPAILKKHFGFRFSDGKAMNRRLVENK